MCRRLYMKLYMRDYIKTDKYKSWLKIYRNSDKYKSYIRNYVYKKRHSLDGDIKIEQKNIIISFN